MRHLKKICCILVVIFLFTTLLTGCVNKGNSKDDKKLDTSWYKENKNEFILKTSGQLYGFAKLSQEKSFEGKTVKLGADIVLNDVDESVLQQWKTQQALAERQWQPIGNESVPFAGTFDGQGHTIKGLYLKTDVTGAGLFGWVSSSAIVQDFKLIDSCIISSNGKVGIIGAGLLSKIENVYTNAYIEAHGTFVGGILGWYKGAYEVYDDASKDNFSKGAMEINNCWFDGRIVCEGKYYAVGGIVGGQDARSKVEIYNCLFSGIIQVDNATTYSRVGGIFGWLNWSAYYRIQNCLSVGTIKSDKRDTVGALIGDLGAIGFKMSYCYSLDNNPIGKNQTGYVYAATCVQEKENFAKLDLERFFPKLEGETECAWVLSKNGTPILKKFVNMTK